jgi:hypothetical protein
VQDDSRLPVGVPTELVLRDDVQEIVRGERSVAT